VEGYAQARNRGIAPEACAELLWCMPDGVERVKVFFDLVLFCGESLPLPAPRSGLPSPLLAGTPPLPPEKSGVEPGAADMEAGVNVRGWWHHFGIASRMQLFALPPISGIMRAQAHAGVDPQSGDSEIQWKRRLARIFAAYARSRPDILSFRLIGVADNGREIVRTNHDRDGIHQVAEPLLQHKAHRPYYQARPGIRQGGVLVSDLNLKQEHGHIETPHTPVLRAATPLFDADGHLSGMLVLDETMLPLFARMDGLETGKDDTDYIVNAAGEILHAG